LTVLDGVSKVGGYFALFGLLEALLYFYNLKSFERDLATEYGNHKKDEVKEAVSYEMFIRIVKAYQRKELELREIP